MKILTTLKLCTLAAACCLATPVMASTPDGETPANEGVCDELKLDGVTKGLYGLCVAFCEAQDCVAEDDGSGNITFGENCKASNPKILDNYNKKRDIQNPADVSMPCVNVAAAECPCWTVEELEILGTDPTEVCTTTPNGQILATLEGIYDGDFGEQALVYQTRTGTTCRYESFRHDTLRVLPVNDAEADSCIADIAAECTSRGF